MDKRDCGYLTREDLLCIPEVNINPLGERLIDVIMDDYGENNKINFKQFIFLLAKFRQGKSRSSNNEFNSREQKLRFLFDVSGLFRSLIYQRPRSNSDITFECCDLIVVSFSLLD